MGEKPSSPITRTNRSVGVERYQRGQHRQQSGGQVVRLQADRKQDDGGGGDQAREERRRLGGCRPNR